MNIPNLLSLARLGAVPLTVWLILIGQMQLAFVLFILAGITDALDGYIAKQWDMQTELGAWLDPAADKTLLVSIFLALGYSQLIPLWLVIIVISRDILIVGAIMISWLMERPVTIRPLFVSKANTAAQIILAALVLANEGFSLAVDNAVFACFLVTGLLTLLSAYSYSKVWLQHMQ